MQRTLWGERNEIVEHANKLEGEGEVTQLRHRKQAHGTAETVLSAARHLHDELEHRRAGSFLGRMAAPASQTDAHVRNGEIPKRLPSLSPRASSGAKVRGSSADGRRQARCELVAR